MPNIKERIREKSPVIYNMLKKLNATFKRQRLAKLSNEQIFTQYYQENSWGDEESYSGAGSNLKQTEVLRQALPHLLRSIGATSLLDLPCGDFHWMNQTQLDLELYIGGDIVKTLIEENTKKYGRHDRQFTNLDLTSDPLPKVDVIFCRDALVHLSFDDIMRGLENIKRSGSDYLLTTTFTKQAENQDIPTGDWRKLNLTKAPFNFPEPINLINEKCTEDDGSCSDKCLALWKISEL